MSRPTRRFEVHLLRVFPPIYRRREQRASQLSQALQFILRYRARPGTNSAGDTFKSSRDTFSFIVKDNAIAYPEERLDLIRGPE